MPIGVFTADTVPELIQEVYSQALAKTLLEESPAYARLNEMGLIETDERTNIRWPAVSEGHGVADNIADGAPLPAATIETYDEAVLSYGIYVKLIRVGRAQMRGSRNAVEFFKTADGANLLAQQVNRAIPQVALGIHNHIVANTTATEDNPIVSLGDAMGSNSNTYAGIDRSTNTFWQPYINDNGGVNRALTEALLEDMASNLEDNRESITDEVWCGRTAFYALKDILNTISPSRNNNPEELRAGAMRLWWQNTPFILMRGMDTNTMRWINFKSDDGVRLKKQHEGDFITKDESTSAYDEVTSIAGHYQLIVHNPWKQGELQDVQ